MATKNNKRQKKKNGASVQELLGIKAFTEYGIQTNRGELLFFKVRPTNISVLSQPSVETKIRQLTLVLSAVPDVEISCTDSAECFDENKAYLMGRAEEEKNEKVRSLIRRDISFLDEIQTEMATARQFLFIARCRNMKAQQVFARANQIQKAISEQGFEARRMDKGEISVSSVSIPNRSTATCALRSAEARPFCDVCQKAGSGFLCKLQFGYTTYGRRNVQFLFGR